MVTDNFIEQGYDGSFNGEAYGSIMYQNENLSVRVSDEFMDAAVQGKHWWTKRVTDGHWCEKKDARGKAHPVPTTNPKSPDRTDTVGNE